MSITVTTGPDAGLLPWVEDTVGVELVGCCCQSPIHLKHTDRCGSLLRLLQAEARQQQGGCRAYRMTCGAGVGESDRRRTETASVSGAQEQAKRGRPDWLLPLQSRPAGWEGASSACFVALPPSGWLRTPWARRVLIEHRHLLPPSLLWRRRFSVEPATHSPARDALDLVARRPGGVTVTCGGVLGGAILIQEAAMKMEVVLAARQLPPPPAGRSRGTRPDHHPTTIIIQPTSAEKHKRAALAGCASAILHIIAQSALPSRRPTRPKFSDVDPKDVSFIAAALSFSDVFQKKYASSPPRMIREARGPLALLCSALLCSFLAITSPLITLPGGCLLLYSPRKKQVCCDQRMLRLGRTMTEAGRIHDSAFASVWQPKATS